MTDTQTLILASAVSFVTSAAIGILCKGSLNRHMALLGASGLTVIVGYFIVFGSWSEPIEFEKLLASLCLNTPGLALVVFLPMIPGYSLGVYLRSLIGKF